MCVEYGLNFGTVSDRFCGHKVCEFAARLPVATRVSLYPYGQCQHERLVMHALTPQVRNDWFLPYLHSAVTQVLCVLTFTTERLQPSGEPMRRGGKVNKFQQCGSQVHKREYEKRPNPLTVSRLRRKPYSTCEASGVTTRAMPDARINVQQRGHGSRVVYSVAPMRSSGRLWSIAFRSA